jgi:hypothetical protein
MQASLKRARKPFIAFLLFVMVLFAATPYPDYVIGACGIDYLNQKNDQYLQASFDHALKGFLVLSTIKSGLAVLEGSEVGVGFNLEIGDIVQSVYDYVDVAWRTALAGGTTLFLLKTVLAAIQALDHWFLFSSLLLILIVFMFNWLTPRRLTAYRWFKELLLFVGSITLGLYILLPFSVAGAAYLSNQVTKPLVAEALDGFSKVEKDLAPIALGKRFFQNDEARPDWSIFGFGATIDRSKKALSNMNNWLEQVSKEFAVWTIKLIAGYLFDCIIFPLTFFIVVYLLTKALLTHVLGISSSRRFQDDLEAVAQKYFRPQPAGPIKDNTQVETA